MFKFCFRMSGKKEYSPSLKEDIISVIAKELQEQISNQNLTVTRQFFKHWRTILTKSYCALWKPSSLYLVSWAILKPMRSLKKDVLPSTGLKKFCRKKSTWWNEFRVRCHNPNSGIHQSCINCTDPPAFTKKKVTFLKKRNSFQSSLSQNLAMLLFPFSRLKNIYTFVCVTMCVTGARTVSVQEVLNIFKNMLVLGLVNIVW